MSTKRNLAGLGSISRAILFFLAVLLAPVTTRAQTSLFDPRFDALCKASEEWDRRAGPDRQVVDMVCLVPDVPTFLEAIKAWDRGHYFPILIDDVEYSFKFLRAFRPARIVRFPGKAEPGDPDQLWEARDRRSGSHGMGKKKTTRRCGATPFPGASARRRPALSFPPREARRWRGPSHWPRGGFSRSGSGRRRSVLSMSPPWGRQRLLLPDRFATERKRPRV